MKILIPKDKALKIIEDRLNELKGINFNQVTAWKSRATAEIQTVFKVQDNRYFEIPRLNFGYDVATFIEYKVIACNLLQSYIDSIKENEPEPSELAVPAAETKADVLSKENSKLILRINELEYANSQLIKLNNDNRLETATLHKRKKELEGSMLQLENFSHKQLWLIIHNLKWSSFMIVVGILVGTFAVGFGAGHVWDLIQGYILPIIKK